MAAHSDALAAPEERLPPYRRATADVIASLGSDPRRGLSSSEARHRLERHGRNELPSAPPVPAWRRLLAQFNDVLTILLLVATAVSFVAWWIERQSPIPYEALTIIAIVILNGVLGFVQESRAEHAVAALRAMSAPNARVVRDGEQRRVTPSLPTRGCWSPSRCGSPRPR
jgi:Ca2+-transporting ATPase